MATGSYIGVGEKARKIRSLYIGVGGKARKVRKGYIGVGGKARLFYQDRVPIGEWYYFNQTSIRFGESFGGGSYNHDYVWESFEVNPTVGQMDDVLLLLTNKRFYAYTMKTQQTTADPFLFPSLTQSGIKHCWRGPSFSAGENGPYGKYIAGFNGDGATRYLRLMPGYTDDTGTPIIYAGGAAGTWYKCVFDFDSGVATDIAAGNNHFVAVIALNGGTTNVLAHSADARHWSLCTITGTKVNGFENITYGGGVFIATGGNADSRYAYSYDGINFVGDGQFKNNGSAVNGRFTRGAYGDGKFLIQDDRYGYTGCIDVNDIANGYLVGSNINGMKNFVYGGGKFLSTKGIAFSDDLVFESHTNPIGDYQHGVYVLGHFYIIKGYRCAYAPG